MQLLNDLIRFVGPQRIRRIETLPEHPVNEEETQLYKLYKGMYSGEITSDKQAESFIYPNGASPSAFRVLKHRLRERLLAQLFFLDMKSPDHPPSNVAIYDANKYLFSAKVLITIGARFIATHLLEKALTISVKFHITDVSLEACRRLQYNAVIHNNVREYERFRDMTKYYLDRQRDEWEAESAVHHLSLVSTQASTVDISYAKVALDYCTRIHEFRLVHDSFTLAEAYFRLLFRARDIAREYDKAIEVCQEGLDYLHANIELTTPLRIAEFNLRMMTCYTLLRDYGNARVCAIACAKNVPEGSYNWFVYMRDYLQMTLKSLDFTSAFQLYQQAINHSGFQKIPDRAKEIWRIFEVYLNYAFDSGWNTESTRRTTWFKKRFNLQEFLRRVPDSTKDKTGTNVAILVVQILYLLEEHDLDEIANRVEALKVYVYRHLNRPDTVRSKLFIKLLLIMDKHGYDYIAVRKHSEKTYKNLLAASTDKQPVLEQAEVLPYDLLWPRILNKLESSQA